MSNAEQGVAQSQIEAARTEQGKADGLQKTQQRNIAYLDDRIFCTSAPSLSSACWSSGQPRLPR